MKARLPFVTVCFASMTRRCIHSHAADAWKAIGGFGSKGEDPSFKDWESHDAGLHNFLKESIPEALAHTGKVLLIKHRSLGPREQHSFF